MSRSMTLGGAVAVVTGAARGVGASLSRQLAAKGARVALLGLEPEELAAVAAACPGGSWWEVDGTDAAALDRAAGEVAKQFGHIDVIVANAGIATGGHLLTSDVTSYERVITV